MIAAAAAAALLGAVPSGCLTESLWEDGVDLTETRTKTSTRTAEFAFAVAGTEWAEGGVVVECERRSGVRLPPAAGGDAPRLWLVLRPHASGEIDPEERERAEEAAALLAEPETFTATAASLAVDWRFEGREKVDSGNEARFVIEGTFAPDAIREWIPFDALSPALREALAAPEPPPIPEPVPDAVAACDAALRALDLSRLSSNRVADDCAVHAEGIVWCDPRLVPFADVEALRRCCGRSGGGEAELPRWLASVSGARVVVVVGGLPGALVLRPDRAWLLAVTDPGREPGTFWLDATLHAVASAAPPPAFAPWPEPSRPGGDLRITCELRREVSRLALGDLVAKVLLTPFALVGDAVLQRVDGDGDGDDRDD